MAIFVVGKSGGPDSSKKRIMDDLNEPNQANHEDRSCRMGQKIPFDELFDHCYSVSIEINPLHLEGRWDALEQLFWQFDLNRAIAQG